MKPEISFSESYPGCAEYANTTLNQAEEPEMQAQAGVARVPADSFCNILLFEGPSSEVQPRVEAVKVAYPNCFEETPETTRRHRAWFASATGGFKSDFSFDHITVAMRFETAPSPNPSEFPPAFVFAKTLLDQAGADVEIGYAVIDTRRLPSAIAAAVCAGCANGIVGTLGGSRSAYFQVMRHFFFADNPNAFFQALVTDQAIGRVPYNHQQQWSESTSPLRLGFRTQDPRRDGWGLTLGSTTESKGFLVKGGYLPPNHMCISSHVSWLDTLNVMVRGEARGILPYFDEDGQLMISGYALHTARIIDENLKPTSALTGDECAEYQLGDPPSKAGAMVAVLKLYAGFLVDALGNIDSDGAPDGRELWMREHLDTAVQWLLEQGHIRPVWFHPGSQAVN